MISLLLSLAVFTVIHSSRFFTAAAPGKRSTSSDTVKVNLGYEVHSATLNTTTSSYVFKNVPYAEPPVDDLRFAKPSSPSGFSFKVNDGGSTEIICMQAYPDWVIALEAEAQGVSTNTVLDQLNSKDGQTEDCLKLDVYVPESVWKGNKNVPVMIWIHGGGFVYGSKTLTGNPGGLLGKSASLRKRRSDSRRGSGDSDHHSSSQDGGVGGLISSLQPVSLLGQSSLSVPTGPSGLLSQAKNSSDGMIFVSINYRLGVHGWLAGDGITTNLGLWDQLEAISWVKNHIRSFKGDPNQVTVMGESAGASSIMHHITGNGGSGSIDFQKAIIQSPAYDFSLDHATIFDDTMKEASSVSGTTVSTVYNLRDLPADQLQNVNQAIVASSVRGHFNYGPVPGGSYVPNYPQALLAEGKFHKDLTVMISHTSNEAALFVAENITTTSAVNKSFVTVLPKASNSTISTLIQDIYPDVLNGTYPWTTEFQRLVIFVSDFDFTCSTYFLATAFGNKTYNYVFAYPPGYHGDDTDYVFYDDRIATDNGFQVNGTVATELQNYLVTFAIGGTPTGNVSFPTYGSAGQALWIGQYGTSVTTDPAKNSRCDWIQQAMARGLV